MAEQNAQNEEQVAELVGLKLPDLNAAPAPALEAFDEPDLSPPVDGGEAPAPASAPLYRGLLKTINDPAELATYAAELERKQIEAEAELRTLKQTRAQVAPADPTPAPVAAKKYAEKLFVDPDAAIEELKSEIKSEIAQSSAKKAEEKAFWDGFYVENADLAGLEDIVQMTLYKNQANWASLPVSQAAKLLATEARAYVARVRTRGERVETLPGAPAAVAGATTGSAPRVVVEAKPKTFTEQLKERRDARKRA
jgi:hypothetical protein